MEKGTILFHKNFRFINGDLGEKLIVLLNDPDPKSEPFLFCRVTSKKGSKPTTPGCQARLSLFFIPQEKDFFQKDTWLQLYEIYSFEAKSVLKDHFDGFLQVMGKLSEQTITALIACIKLIDDISEDHRKLIFRKK